MSLSKQQIKQFKQLLLQERAKFAGEIRTLAQEASKNPREASGDLSSYPVHMADMSADTSERELVSNLASNEQAVLYQIEDALKRIDEGTYGVCQQCQKPIALSRLRAVSYTSLCIGCQRTKEQKK
ncbi:MAG: TraR/DksA C4-type zinc finger protein [Candidatus Omnitrophica bacterium]|nr:TraR/DksA C4-type zinc finger protein [Candidatus Omnitrophota bacterium]